MTDETLQVDDEQEEVGAPPDAEAQGETAPAASPVVLAPVITYTLTVQLDAEDRPAGTTMVVKRGEIATVLMFDADAASDDMLLAGRLAVTTIAMHPPKNLPPAPATAATHTPAPAKPSGPTKAELEKANKDAADARKQAKEAEKARKKAEREAAAATKKAEKLQAQRDADKAKKKEAPPVQRGDEAPKAGKKPASESTGQMSLF
jgi:hypothetical protein